LAERAIRTEQHKVARGLEIAVGLTALCWAAAASLLAGRSAEGIALRFGVGTFSPLLYTVFLLFLLWLGFRALDWVGARGRHAGEILPLPRRPSRAGEWGLGAAIGWGLSLAAVLPLLLSANLHASWEGLRGGWTDSRHWLALVVGVLSLLGLALAQELVFHGYPFRRLAAAIGPNWSAVLLALLFAVVLGQGEARFSLLGLMNGLLLGLLLAMAMLRTNALWTGWGLIFAYRAAAAVVLGLPVRLAFGGSYDFGSLVDTITTGPRWLRGGASGLDCAWVTLPLLFVAMLVLYRTTRDYAWNYTQPVIVPAGYEVVVAPPAAHVAMERSAVPPPPPPLVQILPFTPQTRSVVEVTEPAPPLS
jgi:membrane protease YdiL (CAAX protease family)